MELIKINPRIKPPIVSLFYPFAVIEVNVWRGETIYWLAGKVIGIIF